MTREVRISPEGDAVAIRSKPDDEAWDAWGVMHSQHGGHWAKTSQLEGWTVIQEGSADE